MKQAPHNPDPCLTIPAGAEYTGFSERTLWRRIEDGILPAVRFGPRAVRVRLSALDAWLNSGDPS